jgi:cytidylate kinase
MISTMNLSIREFQDLIGHENDIDLTDINESLENLQSEINIIVSTQLITTIVSILEIYSNNMKTEI